MHITIRQLNQVRGGRKTQIRIPVREPRQVTRKNHTTYTSQPFTPVAGASMTLRIPKSDQTPVRVTITEAATQTLGEITFPDVLAEGHLTTSAFQVWWVQTHDRAWVTRHLEDDQTDLPDDVLFDRFADRHAARPVWAIRFSVDRSERPRFLAAQSDELYTDNPGLALVDEPEAVDEASQARITARAGMHLEQWRVLEQSNRERMELHERLRAVQESARVAGVNISRQEREILRRIQALEAKVRIRAA